MTYLYFWLEKERLLIFVFFSPITIRRETFKIAVLYVAAGQEGEQAILHNSKGSAAYNRFVQDLGWEVELAEHSGYMGGLERNGSNGRTAIYYSSSTLEVLFHEVVRMPTDPDDARQVKKVLGRSFFFHQCSSVLYHNY